MATDAELRQAVAFELVQELTSTFYGRRELRVAGPDGLVIAFTGPLEE